MTLLLILRAAFFGVRRFGQLARNLDIPRRRSAGASLLAQG
jgi:hypothetical protein